MSDDDLLAALDQRAHALSETRFLRLVHTLEERRAAGQAAAIEPILSKLRPRMAVVRPPRLPSARRLLCVPFEDLLYTPGRDGRKPTGRIPRTAVAPIWRLLGEAGDARLIARIEEKLAALGPVPEEAALAEVAESLWTHAAVVLRGSVKRADGNRDQKRLLMEGLGGPEVYASLQEIADILEIADEMRDFRVALSPKPIVAVGRSDVEALVEALKRIGSRHPDRQEYAIFTLIARLDDPSKILDVLERARAEGGVEVVQAANAVINEALMSQAEERLDSLVAGTPAKATDRRGYARQVAGFVKDLTGVQAAVGARAGRAAARRLSEVAGQLKDVVSRELVDSPDAALDRLLGGSAAAGGGTVLPPVTDAPDDAQLAAIESRIITLRLCQGFADELGLAGPVGSRLGSLLAGAERRGEAALAALGDPGLGIRDRAMARANLYGAVRMVELISGPEKADQLRLRGLKLLEE